MSAMSAASRSPMLRPCAPIGGTTWADSPTSATRFFAYWLGCSIVSGNRLRPRLRPGRARRSNATASRRRPTVHRRSSAINRAASAGERNPDHAAAIAGQGHEHAGALRRVKLGRDILVRTQWRDVEGQRRLIESRRRTVMPAASRHSECRPSAPITSRAESDWPEAVRTQRCVFRLDAVRLVVDPRQAGQLGRALFQGCDQGRGCRY